MRSMKRLLLRGNWYASPLLRHGCTAPGSSKFVDLFLFKTPVSSNSGPYPPASMASLSTGCAYRLRQLSRQRPRGRAHHQEGGRGAGLIGLFTQLGGFRAPSCSAARNALAGAVERHRLPA